MNTQQKLDILQGTNGKVFTVMFIKKNGDERIMNCRLGVTKHLKGGVDTKAHIDHMVNVFDMQVKQYRTINVEKLVWAKIAGVTIDFTGQMEVA